MLAISPLPGTAVAPLVQLAIRRRNDHRTSSIACLDIKFYEQKSSFEITGASKSLEAVVPSVGVRAIPWLSDLRFGSVRKTLLPNGLFSETYP